MWVGFRVSANARSASSPPNASQPKPADECFRKCLVIIPDTGMAYVKLYRVDFAKGNRPQALEYLKKARQYDSQRVNIIIEKMGIKD